MATALALAERGRGRTSPNPLVGAVIVDDSGVVVGTGFHERAGEAHAEVYALRAAGARARGATLYCTLEPCSHTGRTGPCAVAVADAGIRRVVAAMQDPYPEVAGRGFAYLRDHGVEVDGRRPRGRGAAPERGVRDQRRGPPAVRRRQDRGQPRQRRRGGARRADGGQRRGVTAARAARPGRGRGHRHRIGDAPRRRSRADGARRVAGAAADPRRVRSPAAHAARGPPLRHARSRAHPAGHDPRRDGRRIPIGRTPSPAAA